LFVCLSYVAKTDRLSPTGFLVGCSAQTSPLFVVESNWGVKWQHRSVYTLVSFVMKPRRTGVSLLGEQRADV